ncbi:MAG: recombination mediator RecR [Spirochaetia bacterium]|nr:recombination mediator RecR [Spirochaetia bacterium]
MYNYPYKLQKLINEVSRLPGIGPKMAERIALYIMKREPEYTENFKEILDGVKDITLCTRCFNVSDGNICSICAEDNRDRLIMCVLESPEDVVMVERTGKFKGYYHILHGLINPLNNMLAENLRIRELCDRVKGSNGEIKELILAINHTVEGDATALYISELMKEYAAGVKITRLAKGLPTGSDIKYADEITLGQAIVERKEM